MVQLEKGWIETAYQNPFNPLRLQPPRSVCVHVLYQCSVILTIDVDPASVEAYASPVWHLSVGPMGTMSLKAIADLLIDNNLGEGQVMAVAGTTRSDQVVRHVTATEFERIRDKLEDIRV